MGNGIALTDLLAVITIQNKEAIAALKEFEQVKDKALASGDKSTLQADFDKLATTLKETNRAFEPLSQTTKLLAQQQQSLGIAVKSGIPYADQAARAYRDLEAAYKSQLTTLQKGSTEYKNVTAQMKAAGSEAQRLEGLVKGVAAAYKPDDLTRYGRALTDITNAEKANLGTKQTAIARIKDYQAALASQVGSLEKGNAEYREVVKVMGQAETAVKRLTGEVERGNKAYRVDELSRFTDGLTRIDTAQKNNLISAEKAAQEVAKLTGEYRDYTAGLGLTERELGLLVTGQRDAATTAGTLATAQERALRAFDSAALRGFAGELQTLVREQREGGTAFDDTARRVTDLQGRLREYGATLRDGSGEQAALNRVLELSDRALTDVGTAAERAQRGFEGSQVRDFATELDRVGGATDGLAGDLNSIEGELSGLSGEFKSSGDAARISADEYGRVGDASRELNTSLNGIEGELSQLVGSLKETGNQAGLSAQDLNRLADVETQLIGTTERLATAQDRANGAYHTEFIRQQVAALNDLKLALEKGRISQEDFVTSAKQIDAALTQARGGLEANTRSYAGYTGALTKVEGSLARAEGRVQKFGIASGVAAGVGDRFQDILYRLGPVGESVGVAMYAAGAGMGGAAIGAKALNIALTVGLVGAVVGAGVAAKNLFDTARLLDTAMTDVSKSTGFSRQEMLGLTDQLQKVSLATGTPTKELLNLAAVAGQMGITGVANVAAFTKALDILTITTDIIGEQGAQQMAQFINVTKEANVSVADSAGLVTNVLVALGNSVAGGEARILAMAQRLGVLKASASLSQTDILGLAGGFVDLGLTAERAEISVTSTFTAISKAASAGGQSLQNFADASGLTAQEFKRLADENPTDAFLALVGGLNAAKASGQDLNPILDKLAGGNNTLRNVLLTLVGGYEKVDGAVRTAREEAVRMSAAQEELANRLAEIDGIGARVLRVFGLLRDDMAIRLIPAFRDVLTGTLDFVRGLAGLEQASGGTISALSAAGTNIRDFTVALFGLGSVTNSVGGQLGEKLGGALQEVNDYLTPLSTQLNTVQQAFINSGADSRNFVLNLLGIKPAAEGSGQATEELATSLDNAGNSALELGTAAEEQKRALENMGRTTQGTKQELETYLQRLLAVRDAYPQLKSALDPLIQTTEANLTLIKNGGAAYVESENKLTSFAAAQEKYNTINRNSLPAQQEFLTQLVNLRDAYPHVTNEIAPLIKATEDRVRALGGEVGASKDAAAATFDLAKAQSTYTDLQRLALPQAQTYLDNLLALKKANPDAAASLNPLITGTQLYIKTLNDTAPANDAAANSLEGLRAKRQLLVDQYNRAEIGSAAQSEALAAIRALDSQIAANDSLSKSATATAEAVRYAYEGITAAFSAGALSGIQASQALEDKLAELKQQRADALLAGEYGTEDFNAIETEIQATNDALYTLNTTLDATVGAAVNIFDPVAAGVRVFYDELGPLRAEILALDGTLNTASSSALGFGSASESAAQAQQTWGAAVVESRQHITDYDESQRTLNKTIADGLTVFNQQDAVLKQLGLAIATDSTNALAAAQAALTMATRDAGNAVLLAKDANRQMGEQSSLTATQTALVTKSQLDVNAALQEAQNAFTITGDAAKFNADKTEIYKAALETLYKNGIDPAKVGLQGWVTALQESEDKVKASSLATEQAEENLKTYEETVKKVSEVQADFNDGVSLSEIPGLVEKLQDAKDAFDELGKGYEDSSRKAQEQINVLNNLRQIYLGFDAVTGVLRDVQKAFNTKDAQEQLDALREKRDKLLEAGNYDGSDLAALNSDISELQNNIKTFETISGVLGVVSKIAETAFESIQSGADASQVAIEGLAAGFDVLAEVIAGTGEQMSTTTKAFVDGTSALGDFFGSLSQGDIFGAISSVFGFFIDQIGNVGKGADEARAVIARFGEDVAFANGLVEDGAYGLEVNHEALAEYEKGLQDAAKRSEEFAKAQAKMAEAVQKARDELAKAAQEAHETLAELNTDVQDARIKFYESTHSGKKAEGQSFIAQTILDFRAESEEFNQLMGDITQKKIEFINTYLAANPGAGRAEANAAAEKIFGPQREALKEQFALTSATILNDAAQQAKDLGLSQKEFYEAVFTGNTEALGSMTEGQRQAIIQFVDLAHEMGIELPKALEEAYGNVNETWDAAGEQITEGSKKAQLATADRIQGEIDALGEAWQKRSDYLREQIANSTGETKAMYEEMLRVEGDAYTTATNGLAEQRNAASAEATKKTVAQLQDDRDALKKEFEQRSQEITDALKAGQITESEAIAQRQQLADEYRAADAPLYQAIQESSDGVGSEIEAGAQLNVTAIENDIATLNTAWAKRSAELQGFIANSTGDAKAAYEEQYRQESQAYEEQRGLFADDLVRANEGLLDAQDKSSSDFIAAQEEIGRKESEALGGIYEQLRALLGPEADLIISMIQSTYDKRRAAYLSGGTASADAAAQANQGELDTLAGIFEQLRALLGPDADVIISMIQGTYDKRQAAYQSGGEASANAATAAAESEAQSIANVNQILRNLFGPEAESIIAQIHALNAKKQEEYRAGGEGNSQAAKLAAESEAQSVANINQLLRNLFGADAEAIIAQIHELNAKKQGAYAEGGQQNASAATEGADAEAAAITDGTEKTAGAVDESTSTTTGALERRTATISEFLARGDVTPQLRTSLEAFNAAIADGGNLSAQEIDAARDKVTTALNDRGDKIRALVADGVPLADAIRQVDLEFARTVDETSAEISRSASEGGTLAAQGIAKGQDVQVAAIEALKSGLLTGVGGLSGQVTPQISEEHRKLMDAFIEGARTSGGGIDAAETAQIQAMQQYQSQLDSSVSGIGGNVAPVISAAHSLIGGAFTTGGSLVKTDVAGALGLITGGIGDYTGVSPLVSSVFGGISSTVTTQGSAVAGDFTRQGSAIETASRSALVAVSGTFSSEGGKLSSTVQSVFNTLTGAQNSGASGFTSTLSSTFGNVNRAIDSGYTLTAQGYQQGGSKSAAAIQAAYSLEEARFKSESAALQNAIQNAKGSEKAKLTAEYNALQNEHAAKSRAYQSAISQASSQEKSALASGASAVIGQLGNYGSSIVGKTNSEFSNLIKSYTSNSDKYKSNISTQSDAIKRALDAAAKVVANFKFPALPAPPRIPDLSGIRRASGDAGINPHISPVSFDAPSIGAYAADALPDYSVATTGVQAYAAATGSLLDLFGDSRALTLSSTQQRDLNLTVSFSGFKDVFTAPAGIFDSAANTFSRATNLYAATVEKFDRIVDRLGGKAGMSTFELARKPLRRRGS